MLVHGHDPAEGETAFAFCVLRFAHPVARDRLLTTLEHVAALIPDAEAVLEDLLPDDLEQEVTLITIPWLPPEAGHGLAAQRRLVESAVSFDVVEAWFFQTGTSLPPVDDEDDDDTDDDTHSIDLFDATDVQQRAVAEDAEETVEEHEENLEWSCGLPPQLADPAFPVDDVTGTIAAFDSEDFGIAIKLAGEMQPGEGTVLLGFHTLWLAPYAGRYRNAGVRIDSERHSAHFWVERFEVPVPAEQLVRHLLWVVSRLTEVVRVIHARFVGATMAEKYSAIMGNDREPFVLGGNPLPAIYAAGGESAIDRWIEDQRDWTPEEVARMLRELAIEIATSGVDDDDDGEDDDDDDDDDDEDGGGGDEDGDDDDDDDDDDDGGEAEGNEDEDRGRQITTYALDLLKARSDQGLLDPRAAERLLPMLAARAPAHDADDQDIN